MKENIESKLLLGQFKLTSGESIIAEVIETEEIRLYRKVLSIITEEDLMEGINFYIFKPYIIFQEDINEIVMINPMHIISSNKPSNVAVKQYNKWWENFSNKDNDSHDYESFDSQDIDEIPFIMNTNDIKNLYSLDSSGVIRINKHKLN